MRKQIHPEWKQWLQDSEKVLKKVNWKLAEEMTREAYRKQALKLMGGYHIEGNFKSMDSCL